MTRSQKSKLWVSALGALCGLSLALAAFHFAGFLGVGTLGLLIGFIAVRMDLEKEGAVSSPFATSLYAQQITSQQHMTRAERAAHRAEMRSFARPLAIAKTISVAMMVFGFGAFFFVN